MEESYPAPETNDLITSFGKSVRRMARYYLTREKAIYTKKLWRSIEWEYLEARGEIKFTMDFYGAFMDKGVSGTGRIYYTKDQYTPVAYNKSEAEPEFRFRTRHRSIGGDLTGWLNNKGLDPNLDYVIRRSIHGKGLRPRRFFTKAWDKYYPKFSKELNVSVGTDVDHAVSDILDEIERTITLTL